MKVACVECRGDLLKNKIRGYCNTCYVRLMRQGLIKKIESNKLKEIDFTQDQIDVLNGILLGDGYLSCYFRKDKVCMSSLRLLHQLRDKDYLEWQYSFFESICAKGVKESEVYDVRTKKVYYNASFSTLTYKEIGDYRLKWYPEPEKKKIVPKDLILTPLTLAMWFLDDGNLRVRKTDTSFSLEIRLYTDGFVKSDVEFLCTLLSKRFKGYFAPVKHQSHYSIYFSTVSVIKFLKEIDRVIPKGVFLRKTEIWRGKDFNLDTYKSKIKSLTKNSKIGSDVEFLNYLKTMINNDVFIFSLPRVALDLNWIIYKYRKPKPSTDKVISRVKKFVELGYIIECIRLNTNVLDTGRFYEFTEKGKEYFQDLVVVKKYDFVISNHFESLDVGYKNSRAKLNKNQLQEIRGLLSDNNLKQKEIAKIYNVSEKLISKIKLGHRYKNS